MLVRASGPVVTIPVNGSESAKLNDNWLSAIDELSV